MISNKTVKIYINKYITIPIIKEQFFSSMYRSLSKYTNPVVTIDHHYFSVTVWINRMIGKSDFVPFPGSINNKVCRETQVFMKYPY